MFVFSNIILCTQVIRQKKYCCNTLCIDLDKTFDIVYQTLLFVKLFNYGFRNTFYKFHIITFKIDIKQS